MTPAMAVRLGVCYYLLGRTQRAIETLRTADGSALALFYLGASQFGVGNYAEAIASYNAASGAGYNGDQCALAIAEAQRYMGDAAGALATLDALFGAVEQTAEYLYQRGGHGGGVGRQSDAKWWRCTSGRWRRTRVTPGPCLAWPWKTIVAATTSARCELYERAVQGYPTHVGALLNLGIMYEDRQQFEQAQSCYRRILDSFPNDPRARLYFKDACASSDMFYDEEAQKRNDRLNQVLSIPVTDFELSVRSRNCLQKMGIKTLGDLTRTTELELLASKNFGETSLVEIRDMLHSKGLDLGQFVDRRPEPELPIDVSQLSPDEQAMLDRPICGPESVGAGPQVHGPAGHDHDRRADSQDGRRPAGVQELRRDQPERSAREAGPAESQVAWRLMVAGPLSLFSFCATDPRQRCALRHVSHAARRGSRCPPSCRSARRRRSRA